MPYDAPEMSKLSLGQIAELVAQRKLPPVASWNPTETSDSKMHILNDGRWFHDGGEITRPAMIRAFSSLLRRDAKGAYWLVTPYEKQSITVDDVPFLAVELRSEGAGMDRSMAFRLNTDDLVIAGQDHAIEWRGDGSDGLPYLHVREGLWARMSRPVYYELAELAIAENPQHPSLSSGGILFHMGPA